MAPSRLYESQSSSGSATSLRDRHALLGDALRFARIAKPAEHLGAHEEDRGALGVRTDQRCLVHQREQRAQRLARTLSALHPYERAHPLESDGLHRDPHPLRTS